MESFSICSAEPDEGFYETSLEEKMLIYEMEHQMETGDTPHSTVSEPLAKRQPWRKGPYNQLREHYITECSLNQSSPKPRLFETHGVSELSLNEITEALHSSAAVFVLSLGETFEEILQKLISVENSLFESSEEESKSDSDSALLDNAPHAMVIPLTISEFPECVSEAAIKLKFQHSYKQFERILMGVVNMVVSNGSMPIILCDIDVPSKELDMSLINLLAEFETDQKALVCLLCHSEQLFTNLVQRYRMVLPLHAMAVWNLNKATSRFDAELSKMELLTSADTTLPHLYRSILNHKTKDSPSYLIITVLLELEQEKLISESNASLENDVLSNLCHAVSLDEIRIRMREQLKSKRRVLTGIDALIQQEIGRLNNEERSLAARADIRLIEVCPNGSVFVPMKYSEISAVLCDDPTDAETKDELI